MTARVTTRLASLWLCFAAKVVFARNACGSRRAWKSIIGGQWTFFSFSFPSSSSIKNVLRFANRETTRRRDDEREARWREMHKFYLICPADVTSMCHRRRPPFAEPREEDRHPEDRRRERPRHQHDPIRLRTPPKGSSRCRVENHRVVEGAVSFSWRERGGPPR